MKNESLPSLTIGDFLDRLAADSPTPGGGSVAALTGALAAALGQMVAGFTLGRKKFADVEAQVRTTGQRLVRARQMLRKLIDEDAVAYGVLSEAFKLDKADPQRAERVRQAAGLAGSVPLETATVSSKVLADLEELGRIGNPLLRPDVEAATHLARAAIAAAAANVRANLSLMNDEDAKAIEEQLKAVTPGS